MDLILSCRLITLAFCVSDFPNGCTHPPCFYFKGWFLSCLLFLSYPLDSLLPYDFVMIFGFSLLFLIFEMGAFFLCGSVYIFDCTVISCFCLLRWFWSRCMFLTFLMVALTEFGSIDECGCSRVICFHQQVRIRFASLFQSSLPASFLLHDSFACSDCDRLAWFFPSDWLHSYDMFRFVSMVRNSKSRRIPGRFWFATTSS